MGRDRKRVLVCAIASLVAIIAGTLVMDWYRVSFDGTASGLGKMSLAVDLLGVHSCTAIRVCATTPLGPLPGMFPTLAAVTLWSSLAFAALVAVQAGIRLLTGNANDSIAKFGYMFALATISIAFATAYLFGPETEGPVIGMAAELGLPLQRTWAPLTLIIGQVAGFATLYMAVSSAPAELGDSYKPVTLVTLRPMPEHAADAASGSIPLAARTATRPMRPGGRTATAPPAAAPHLQNGHPPRAARPTTGQLRFIGPMTITGEFAVLRDPTAPEAERPTTGQTMPGARPEVVPGARPETMPGARPEITPGVRREPTGQLVAKRETMPGVKRETTPGIKRDITPGAARRETMPGTRRETTGQLAGKRETTGPLPAIARTKSGPIHPIPEHLRNRLRYVAVTAELTGGGIDARREDGSARLVLWRDVVGVVARRLPPAYDGTTFVDIVSTAGSTLRIVPWTRLSGDLVAGEGDERPRSVVEHVTARCPGAKLDPATRQFLETGTAAQLRDIETLHAHDARLA